MKTKPVKIKSDNYISGQNYSHPAFGCISFTRFQGNAGNLFLSPVKNGHGITLTISEAEKRHHFNENSHMRGSTIVEIMMSPAQWADFLCSNGNYNGIPCTITGKNHAFVEQISDEEESAQETFSREFNEDCQEVGIKLEEVIHKMTNLSESKSISKKEIKEVLSLIKLTKQHIDSNLPFVYEQFLQFVEKAKTAGKHEMVAWATAQGLNSEILKLENKGDNE